MKRKTILHIIDTTGPGGAETVFTQLASSTQQKGLRTIALIRGAGWVKNELQRLNIETHIRECKGSFNVSYLIFLIKLIIEYKVTIIQSHLLGSNVYASMATLLTRRPLICTFHGHVDISPGERLRFIKFLLLYLGSDKIVAVTHKLKDLIVETNFKIMNKKVLVIPNGIDEELFSCKEKKSRMLVRKTIQIGCLGNIRFAKNYDLAIEFIRLLRDKGFDVNLKVAGDNSTVGAKKLLKKAKKLHVDDAIEFLGFIKEAHLFLTHLDIFLMTSSTEGHPLALTQALSCEIPILTTPSGIEEIVSEKTIFISKEHTSQSLFLAFTDLTNSSTDELEEKGRMNRVLVINEYSLSAMFHKYMNLYSEFYG